VLILLTASLGFGLVGGFALAYLMDAEKRGQRGLKAWAIWLGAMASFYGLAHALGFAGRQPEVTDLVSFAGVVAMVTSFWASFSFLRRRLRRRPQ
jgi:Mn2+/Fe2+ NRAMP family transporter